MDLLKHGESAYPAAAWVEKQYMEDGQRVANGLAIVSKEVMKVGLPPNMNFSRQVSFNEANENCNSDNKEEARKKDSEDAIRRILTNGFNDNLTRRQSF